MKKLIIFLLLTAVLLFACTDDRRSIEVLTNLGFYQIKITGHKFFVCSEEDTYSTGFTALTSKGSKVRGAVCCGILKGCTIRYY